MLGEPRLGHLVAMTCVVLMAFSGVTLVVAERIADHRIEGHAATAHKSAFTRDEAIQVHLEIREELRAIRNELARWRQENE